MKSNADEEKLAEEAIRGVLADVPFVTDVAIEAPPLDPHGVDLRVELRVGQTVQRLVCAVGSSGQPRIVRSKADQLRLLRQVGGDAYPVILAPFISEQSAKICEDKGVGHIDFAGNCFLSFGTVHIREQGRKNPFKSDRKLKSIYKAKSSRILRVMLSAPSKRWRVEPLSTEAGVSLGLVSEVRRELLNREWASTDDQGLFLTAPGELLEAWGRNYDMEKNKTSECYSVAAIPDLEAGIARVCTNRKIRYALAAFSAGARLAPNVRYSRVAAFVAGSVSEVSEQLGVKRVASGANLWILTPYDDGVFHDSRTVDGVWVTSPIQTYLDLRQLKGRGDEAAKALLEQVIQPQW